MPEYSISLMLLSKLLLSVSKLGKSYVEWKYSIIELIHHSLFLSANKVPICLLLVVINWLISLLKVPNILKYFVLTNGKSVWNRLCYACRSVESVQSSFHVINRKNHAYLFLVANAMQQLISTNNCSSKLMKISTIWQIRKVWWLTRPSLKIAFSAIPMNYYLSTTLMFALKILYNFMVVLFCLKSSWELKS
jgi:hypothetical protein